MMDFIFYFIFSGFEYFSILMLIYGFFNLNPSYHKLEIAISVIVINIISYFFVKNNLNTIIPMPFMILLVFVIMFISVLGVKKWAYSIVITIGGLITYLLLQMGITLIFLIFNKIDLSQINDAFNYKIYLMQVICGSVAIAIGYFNKITSSGFGFMFRKGKVLGFILTSITLFLILIMFSYGFYLPDNFIIIVSVTLISIIFLIIFFVLSHKRDKAEYEKRR